LHGVPERQISKRRQHPPWQMPRELARFLDAQPDERLAALRHTAGRPAR
jgi:hypothetical protein